RVADVHGSADRFVCDVLSILFYCPGDRLPLVFFFFFFKQKTAYEIGLGIPAEPLFRSLLRVSGIVMRLRMFLLLITFLKASHSFRNRLLVICKNAYLFATMIMTSVSSPFSCCSGIVRLNLM